MFVTLLQFKYFINRLNTLKLFNRYIKKITRLMDVETDVGCSPGVTSTSSQSCAEKSGSCLLNMTVQCANVLVVSLNLYLHQNKDRQTWRSPYKDWSKPVQTHKPTRAHTPACRSSAGSTDQPPTNHQIINQPSDPQTFCSVLDQAEV